MRPILLAAVLFIAPVLAGCPPEVIPTRAESSIVRSYKLNETLTARSGETMVSMVSTTSAPVYEVAIDYAPPQHDVFQGGLDYPALIKGARFMQVATRGDGLIGLSRPDYGVTRPARGSRPTFLPVMIWIDSTGTVSSTMEGKTWTRDRLFMPTASRGGANEMSRTQIVFNNVDGAFLNATHNVYAGDATLLKSLPLRFDISENKTIAYLNLQIEVVNASATQIEYRVLSDE